MKKLIVILFVCVSFFGYSQDSLKYNIGINIMSQRRFYTFHISKIPNRKDDTFFLSGITLMKHHNIFDSRINLNYYFKNDSYYPTGIWSDHETVGEIDIKELEMLIGLRKAIVEKNVSPYMGADICLAYVYDRSDLHGYWFNYDEITINSLRYGINVNFGLQFKIKKKILISLESSAMLYQRTHKAYDNRIFFFYISNFAVSYGF